MTLRRALRDLLLLIDEGEVVVTWKQDPRPSRMQEYTVATKGHALHGWKINVYIDFHDFDYIESIVTPSGERVMLYGDGQVDDYYPADKRRWGLS